MLVNNSVMPKEEESSSNRDSDLNTSLKSESEFLSRDDPNKYDIGDNFVSEHHEPALNIDDDMCNILEDNATDPLFIPDHGSMGHNNAISLSDYQHVKTEFDSEENTTELQDRRTPDNCEESMNNCEDGSQLNNSEDVSVTHPFTCVHCSKSFQHTFGLSSHMRMHNIERPFKCQYCTKVFCKPYLRTNHVSKFHRKECRFKCQECDMAFVERSQLVAHSYKHSATKFFKCYLCKESFSLVKTLKKHIKIHNDKYISMCTYCRKPFTDDNDCKSHMKECECKPQKSGPKVDGSNSDNSEYKCTVCDKSFAEKCMYRSHTRVHENEDRHNNSHVVLSTTLKNESEFLTYGEPNKYDIDENVLSEHHEAALNIDNDMCNIPEDNTSDPLFIPDHGSMEHNDAIPDADYQDVKIEFDCEENATELQDHITPDNCEESMCNNEDGRYLKDSEDVSITRPFTCVHCSKQFRVNCNLKAHMRVHTGECPFKCRFCDKAFRKRHSRTIHVSKIHRKECRFQCAVCYLAFVDKPRFLAHGRKHLKTRRFKCYLCKKSFNWITTLYEHIKIHNDKYIYMCAYCRKPFTDNVDCIIHKKKCKSNPQKFESEVDGSNNDNSEYNCSVCGKTFTEECMYKLHIKVHRSERESGGMHNIPKDTIEAQNCTTPDTCEESMCNSEDGSHLKDSKDICTIRQFACVHCPKRYSFKCRLERHMRTHTGERPFKCQFCYMAFGMRHGLTNHIRKVHSEKCQVRCPQCDQAFVDKSNLLTHICRYSKTKCFKCYWCEKSFRLVKNLHKHIKIHNDQYISMCTYCWKPFSDDTDCNAHENKCESKPQESELEVDRSINNSDHHESETNLKESMDISKDGSQLKDSEDVHRVRQFECVHCSKRFKFKCRLQRHMRTHTDERPFKCQFCDMAFREAYVRTIHVSKIHTKEFPFKCEQCDETFMERFEVVAHSYKHSKTKCFKCYLCEKSFNLVSNLYKHIKIYNQYVLICTYCWKPFTDSMDCKARTNQCESKPLESECEVDGSKSNNSKYSCFVCGTTFTKKYLYKRHIKVHEYVESFECNECGEVYRHKFALIRHQKVHSGVHQFKCICNRSFFKRYNLMVHMRSHTDHRPFKCNYCDKSFCTERALSCHMKIHSIERRQYKCIECDKTFYSKVSLRSHLAGHAGQAFVCQECQKSFSSTILLRKHQKSHYAMRSFQCHFCGKVLRTNRTLMEHLRLHSGDRPFMCEICAKTFITQSTLKDHAKIHSK